MLGIAMRICPFHKCIDRVAVIKGHLEVKFRCIIFLRPCIQKNVISFTSGLCQLKVTKVVVRHKRLNQHTYCSYGRSRDGGIHRYTLTSNVVTAGSVMFFNVLFPLVDACFRGALNVAYNREFFSFLDQSRCHYLTFSVHVHNPSNPKRQIKLKVAMVNENIFSATPLAYKPKLKKWKFGQDVCNFVEKKFSTSIHSTKNLTKLLQPESPRARLTTKAS